MIRYLRVRNPQTRGLVSLPQIGGAAYLVGGLKVKSPDVSVAPADFVATMIVDDFTSEGLIVDDRTFTPGPPGSN